MIKDRIGIITNVDVRRLKIAVDGEFTVPIRPEQLGECQVGKRVWVEDETKPPRVLGDDLNVSEI